MTSLEISSSQPPPNAAMPKDIPLPIRAMRFMFARVGPILPQVMGRFACKLWFKTRPKPKKANEMAFIASADRTYQQTIAGKKAPVYVWENDGPTILMVHGWEGRGGQFGEIAQPLLAAGYRIISFDAPGHGQAEGSSTDVEEIYQLIDGILKKEGPVQGMVTHSFGAVTSTFAMSRGLQPKRIVFISAPSQYQYLVRVFQGMLSLPEKVVKVMIDQTRKKFAHWPHSMEVMMNVDQNPPTFPCKVLLIHDTQDKVVKLEQAQRIAHAWPNTDMMRTHGLGHSKILQYQPVIERISHFFKDL